MRVGVVNNNLYPQNYRVGFQGSKIDTTQRLIRTAVQISENSAPPMTEAKYKQIIKTLIKSSEKLNDIKDEIITRETIKRIQKAITSKETPLTEQKKAVKKVFQLNETAKKESREIIKDYIDNEFVTNIVRTKNQNLADYVLKITKSNNKEANEIGRLKLIEKLGGRKHINEVRQIVENAKTKYAQKPINGTFEDYVKLTETNEINRFLTLTIENEANIIIRKLRLMPNF